MPAPARKFLFALLLATALAVSPLAAQEQSWYLLLLAGKRAGTQTETIQPQPEGTLRTVLFLRLAVNRFGQAFTVTQRQTWIEDESLRSVDSETELNGKPESLAARVQGEDLFVQERRSSGSSDRRLLQTGPLLGPRGAADRLRAAFAEGPIPPAPRGSFPSASSLPKRGTCTSCACACWARGSWPTRWEACTAGSGWIWNHLPPPG